MNINKDVLLTNSNSELTVQVGALFIENKNFQNSRLMDVVTFYESYNQSLNFNSFDKLKPTSQTFGDEVTVDFLLFSEYLENYEQTFKKVEVNRDSYKFENRSESVLAFDMYIDLDIKFNFTSDSELSEDVLRMKTQFFTVTEKYDDTNKIWVIDSIHASKFKQDTSDWKSNILYNLPNPSKGVWNRNLLNNLV
ncbi:hypothetical protein IGI39_004452 [Enterococcus sp. AZ135]|uniref:hypothetical protein n=1 Tax=unclassified Enterococcus TaxID=2608891 RepID=UPI003F23AA84